MPITRTYLFLFLFLSTSLTAQQISRFTWDNSLDPTVADFGPNATSINAFATVKQRTDDNTRGLAPGAGSNKADLDLVLTDDPSFDVPGIDLSYDFLRNENSGTILRRGQFFFGRASEIVVNYAIEDGVGGFTTVLSDTEPIPNDGAYHNLRFRYDPEAGNAELFLDGTQVWTNTEKTPGRALYWEGAGDLVIGIQIDATGSGNAVLDDFDFQQVGGTALPVTFGSLRAREEEATVRLEWTTHAESENDYFEVQRSTPAGGWITIGRVAGAGDSRVDRRYAFSDEQPPSGSLIYRLRQVDYDGTAVYSELVSVTFGSQNGHELRVFPTLTTGWVTVQEIDRGEALGVYDTFGREVLRIAPPAGRQTSRRIDLTVLPAGWYFLRSDPTGSTASVRKR